MPILYFIQIKLLILDYLPPPFLYMATAFAILQSDGTPPCFIKNSERFSDHSVKITLFFEETY